MNGVTASEMMAGTACSRIRYGHRAAVPTYTAGQNSTLLISREYVNKTDKIGGMRTNTNIYRQNGASADILT